MKGFALSKVLEERHFVCVPDLQLPLGLGIPSMVMDAGMLIVMN